MIHEVLDFLSKNTELILNSFSVSAQFVLVYFAYKALSQIVQMKEQNSLAREKTAIDELRNFAALLLDYEKLLNLRKSKNTQNLILSEIEMDDFSLSETIQNEKLVTLMAPWHIFYKFNDDIYLEGQNIANKLEVISAALKFGTAKLAIIKDAISVAFCGCVESNAYIYIKNRHDGFMLFPNTIYLYKLFKPEVMTRKEQNEKVKIQFERIFKSIDKS